jgi:hypothetical protein
MKPSPTHGKTVNPADIRNLDAHKTNLNLSAVANKDAPGALFNTWLSVAARPLLACIIPRLLQIGFTYAQPFLITSAIEFAVTPRGKPYDNRGYGLIGAFAIVYTGLAVSISASLKGGLVC